MKVIHDDESDTVFVRLAEAPIAESEEVAPGVILDYDAEGRIVGFEILKASENLSRAAEVLGDHATAA